MVFLSLNPQKCAGCGFCINCNSNLFGINKKDHKARLRQEGKLVNILSVRLSPKKLKEIKGITKGCPAQAITIIK